MQPIPPTISRETVLVDRRQPALRWSAVFAGAACSIGLWMLLQLLGLGIGLAAVDVNDVRSLQGAGIGTTVWSLIAPLIAMFLGGLMAGKLAQTSDRKLAGAHGVVMWALTAVVGLFATISIASMITARATRSGGAFDGGQGMASSWDRNPTGDYSAGSPAGAVDTDALLGPINQRLAAQGKAAVTAAQLDAALRGVARSGIAHGNFEQELLVDQLVAHTHLSRADAADVERQLEARWEPRDGEPYAIERSVERATLGAADAAGKALTTVGVSLLLSLIASVLGAVLALHRSRRGGGERRRGVHNTEPGYAPPVDPVPGPAAPVVPPADFTVR
jgi:hypothetical protein